MSDHLKVLCAALGLLAAGAAYGQSNLDKAVSTKPTVRTEIARGQDAAFQCGLHSTGRFRQIEACVSRIREENVQQQKASNAFRLGLYLSALAEWEAVGPNNLHPEDNQPAAIELGVNVWRNEVKNNRAALKLTEKDICAAITMKCEAVRNSLAAIK